MSHTSFGPEGNPDYPIDHPDQPWNYAHAEWSDGSTPEQRRDAWFNRRREAQIKETVSERGFIHLDPVETSYGALVRIYESSSAIGPHIWLALDQPPGTSVDQKLGEVHAHCSLAQAEEIHAQLGHMIARAKENWDESAWYGDDDG